MLESTEISTRASTGRRHTMVTSSALPHLPDKPTFRPCRSSGNNSRAARFLPIYPAVSGLSNRRQAYRSAGRFERFQIVVGSNELSIIVASFNGAVQIVEGFIAAARCCGSAGEVVPQPEHIPVVNRALIAAYSGYGVEVELFSILVASGSNQRGTEDPSVSIVSWCRGPRVRN